MRWAVNPFPQGGGKGGGVDHSPRAASIRRRPAAGISAAFFPPQGGSMR